MSTAWGYLASHSQRPKSASFPAIDVRPPRLSVAAGRDTRPSTLQLTPRRTSQSNISAKQADSSNEEVAGDMNNNVTLPPAAAPSSDAPFQQPLSKRARTASTTGGTRRRHYICSICAQAFARAEHLIRHERSHRKERPFSCKYCDTMFTRKDLIKRHMTRYHQDILDAQNSAQQTQQEPTPTLTEGQDADVQVSPAGSSAVTGILLANSEGSGTSPMNASDGSPAIIDGLPSAPPLLSSTADHAMQDFTQQLDINSPRSMFDFDSFMSEMTMLQTPNAFTPRMMMDFARTEVFLPYDSQMMQHQEAPSQDPGNITSGLGLAGQSPTEGSISDPVLSRPAPITIPQPQHASWRSFCEVSEQKRQEISENVTEVFCLARVNTEFRLPSCIALERYISTFFDSFLTHLPCIHVPTWRAEVANPGLLLAMAALGANYHYERDLAYLLHRAARLSILNYMERSSFTSKNRPVWVMQALFCTMAFGTWSGDFDMVQEALAFEANTAHIVRYVQYPRTSWGADSNDRSLSWEQWIEVETNKRTKLCVYAFFNNLTLAFSVPPALVNSEVNIDLPSSEAEWTAPTAEAWSQIRNNSITPTPPFSIALRSLLFPQEGQPMKCSAFGSYIMMHALLQQIWHIRQASLNGDDAQELTMFEPALQKWQAMWEANMESSLSPRSPHGPLAFNSSAQLRLAYVRLCVDFDRLKAAVATQNPQAICHAMKTHLGGIKRSPANTKAALYAIHALRIPVRLGMNLVARTGSLVWSLQHHLYSLECCLFLSKWLEAIHAPSAEPTWTEDERRVEALVGETLAEVELDPAKATKPKSALVLYAWGLMFNCLDVWGIIPVLGSSFMLYADSIPNNVS